MARKKDITNFKGLAFDKTLSKELDASTPRAAVILAAAVLEVHVEKLIKQYLIEDKKAVENFIGEFNTPLGSFSAKIKAAYCLGLIEKEIYKDLDRIRDLRNIMAHHINGCDFNEPYVATSIKNFLYNKELVEDKIAKEQDKDKLEFRFNVEVLLIELYLTVRLKQIKPLQKPATIPFKALQAILPPEEEKA